MPLVVGHRVPLRDADRARRPQHAALKDAGFDDIKIDRSHVDRTYPSAEAWWDWFRSGGARAYVESLPEATQEQFRDRGLERLRDASEYQRTRRFVGMLAVARPA